MDHTPSGLTPQHQRHVNAVAARLSLRPPQRESLEILARIAEIVPLDKDAQDLDEALRAVHSEFPSVEDFERDFPSLAFALATGVGKTRLMGAFATYLHRAHGIRHFFVLAPNLTIYDKLKADFTPGTPKYVFQGIAEFAQTPPLLITGENYESSLAVRGQDLFGQDERVHINVFNISKLNKDAKETKGAAPRIKRLSEYIGQSYFEYLAELDDLVLMMDESHRYRADAGVKALNELRPVLGLELTATPQVETGGKAIPFRNVVYSYPLANAIRDGFVKEPAVATREDFNADAYSESQLERLKLEDGIRLHESVKAELETYARQAGQPRVKPFMLVVAQDTTHADALVETIQQDAFFDGRYKDRVITVHSNQRGEEKEETIERLLAVEDPAEATEIVVHVNMLKEGWDVTNLYTIVPLRTANSRTLVEQSIGRGLRLPFGTRTGVPEVDRLTIVSHDRFEEIIQHANDPDSVIRKGVIIGRDVPKEGKKAVSVEPLALSRLTGTPSPADPVGGDGAAGAPPDGGVASKPVFQTNAERDLARVTLDVIERYRQRTDAATLPNVEALKRPEVRAEITKVVEAHRAYQPSLAGLDAQAADDDEPVDVDAVVDAVIRSVVDGTISIPRVVVIPTGTVQAGFGDFDLDTSQISFQPVDQRILVQHLQSGARHMMNTAAGVAPELRPEDYVVRNLIDFPDVDYQTHAALLYKLAGQVVAHLNSYLSDEDAVRNVLQFYEKQLAAYVHVQMQDHFEAVATEYEARVTSGFESPKNLNYAVAPDEPVRSYRNAVGDQVRIRSMQFGSFGKCLYPVQRFDSHTELEFARILEADDDVLRWFRPVKGQVHIYFQQDRAYEPDFIVETKSAKYLCETKMRSEMSNEEVIEKKAAAETWCAHATAHEEQHDGKPWRYLLVPHDDVKANYTLQGLAAKYSS